MMAETRIIGARWLGIVGTPCRVAEAQRQAASECGGRRVSAAALDPLERNSADNSSRQLSCASGCSTVVCQLPA